MIPFVHLHVHSQYSILDGQAAVKDLVDKAISNGMRGMALTDHGTMYGIKELHDYVGKKNSAANGEIKELGKQLEELEANGGDAQAIEEVKSRLGEARSKLFKPIFGCEVYVANGSQSDRSDKNDRGRHLILLAKNEKGYHNLVKIVSNAWTDGLHYHPRTDKEHLEKYHEGLIVCSACLGGEVPRLIMQGNIDGAREVVKWFHNIWGDDYYLELQRHKATAPRANHETYPHQMEVNKVLMKFAKELGIKVVCTNDSHFVNEDDADAHERLICLSTGKRITDNDIMLYSKQEWFKTQEEMNEVFADVPEALESTTEILDKVEFYSINHKPILPDFPLPEGFTNEDDYLRHLVYEGAKERWPELDDEHRERLDFELETIKNMGFPGYFLIVQDYIKAAPRLGCSVGPGRGSAAGSAVAYCLGITNIDPIKYDLLFERFLNPDRISLPDIDVDFDDDGRAEVLKYVTEKYGAEKVAHIITYGTMAAKMAIKDVARVENLSIPESNRLAKFIPSKPNDMPDDPSKPGKKYKISIKNCLKAFPEFAAEKNNPDPLVRDTIRFAEKLEGNVRSTGVHACGVIIGRDDITDWVPVSTATDKDGSKLIVTQYEGSVIEDTGLLKMDFLGLKTLSIIKEALENIKATRGIEFDIEKIPIDDPATYQLYCEGRTTGTFQFESPGMQKYLIQLHPSTFEDLIAMNALYRPGPMDYIPQFIRRKRGDDPIVYDIHCMEKYLKDTYGITVYQEQVMLLSRQLAGFTRGQSDTLRKAMGKKQIDKMNHLEGLFYEGGEKNGHDRKVLNKIWEDWKKFASYAFNKSHATCYSWVAYQTAYLKANYPSEYMAAVLSRNLNDVTKLSKFMDECKVMGIAVKGPDINESRKKFSANKNGDIRFGLAGIRGLGGNAVDAIIAEREQNGPFTSLYDFVERVNLTACNRKAIELLALAGALDCFSEISREAFFEANSKNEVFSETLVRYGQQFQTDKKMQSTSLFGDIEPIMIAKPVIPKAERWPEIERLSRERDLVGMYLSAHPLDPFFMEMKFGCNTDLRHMRLYKDLNDGKGNEGDSTSDEGEEERETLQVPIDQELVFGGIVVDYTERPSKKGGNFGIMKIEDYTDSYEIALFDKNFLNYRNYGIVGNSIVVRASFNPSRYNPSKVMFNIKSIEPLNTLKGHMINNLRISLNEDDLAMVDMIKDQLTATTENRCELLFRMRDSKNNRNIDLRSRYKIPLSKKFLLALDDMGIKYEVNV
ncbi:MAG: DNA polymerase III subunit alpha [Muribaculaceae bacterium]|nr:DNA polymerase III subunit alpha [Muribaculaceae bacterium]